MVGARPDIDRLIEEGLSLYGQGDLDGALGAWEQVLLLDPDNAQATSYVDYVRMNYEILSTEVAGEDGAPFGIADDEPEYQIEILPGEELGASGSAPMYIDPTDHGWALLDESARTADGSEPQLLVLEVDEPADASAMGIARVVVHEPEPEPEAPPISFDDATREYPGGPPAQKAIEILVDEDEDEDEDEDDDAPAPPADAGTDAFPASEQPAEFQQELTPGFGELTPGFASELTPGFGFGEPSDYHTPPGGFLANTPGFHTTPGFGNQTTDVREVNTGFVQPTKPAARKRPGPPELQMTLRTPDRPDASAATEGEGDGEAEPELDLELAPPDRRPRADLPAPPPADSPVALSYGSEDEEEQPTIAQSAAKTAAMLADDEQDTVAKLGKASTRELPPAVRPPARASSSPPPPTQPTTRDFPPQKTDKLPANLTYSVSDRPQAVDPIAGPGPDVQTAELPTFPAAKREMMAAPTRDLGLRPPGKPSNPEDDPTTQSDVRRIRAEAAATQADVILPFDPIDARSAEILEAIDRNAPPQEQMDDRTRRRIATLVERAVDWNRAGDHERAVTAIDLALSEDPNSALAQKLIHRHRESIMLVFQAYLGDLDRQPTLARPLHELGSAPISPRAAFLLSRIDGTLSLDEILDVSGMPRIEAYRYLCQLFLRGILR